MHDSFAQDLPEDDRWQRHMAERADPTITEVAGARVSTVPHPQVTIDAILAAASAVGEG